MLSRKNKKYQRNVESSLSNIQFYLLNAERYERVFKTIGLSVMTSILSYEVILKVWIKLVLWDLILINRIINQPLKGTAVFV